MQHIDWSGKTSQIAYKVVIVIHFANERFHFFDVFMIV